MYKIWDTANNLWLDPADIRSLRYAVTPEGKVVSPTLSVDCGITHFLTHPTLKVSLSTGVRFDRVPVNHIYDGDILAGEAGTSPLAVFQAQGTWRAIYLEGENEGNVVDLASVSHLDRLSSSRETPDMINAYTYNIIKTMRRK